MKKFLAIVLAAIMICVSFVACSSKTDDKSNNDSQQATLTMATNAEFPRNHDWRKAETDVVFVAGLPAGSD